MLRCKIQVKATEKYFLVDRYHAAHDQVVFIFKSVDDEIPKCE